MALSEKIIPLLDDLPEAIRDFIISLLPQLESQSEQWLFDWIKMVIQGNTGAALALVVPSMTNEELGTLEDQVNNDMATLNTANAAQIQWQKDALTAFVDILIKAGIAALTTL